MEHPFNSAGPDISMHHHQTLVLSQDIQMTDSCPLLSIWWKLLLTKEVFHSQSQSGNWKNYAQTLFIPDNSKSHSDMLDSPADNPGSPRGKHRGRLKWLPIKVP
jgi:hypothetical protein